MLEFGEKQWARLSADFAVFAAVRVFFLSLSLLPRPLGYCFCHAIAAWIYLVDRKHRRIGLINLGIAFPDRDESWRRKTLLRSYRQLGDLAVEMTVSIGLTELRPEMQDVDALLAHADAALYRAKDAGRDRVERA